MVLRLEGSWSLLVGKRFLSLLGDDEGPWDTERVAEWPWKAGRIRAVSHTDISKPDLKVSASCPHRPSGRPLCSRSPAAGCEAHGVSDPTNTPCFRGRGWWKEEKAKPREPPCPAGTPAEAPQGAGAVAGNGPELTGGGCVPPAPQELFLVADVQELPACVFPKCGWRPRL